MKTETMRRPVTLRYFGLPIENAPQVYRASFYLSYGTPCGERGGIWSTAEVGHSLEVTLAILQCKITVNSGLLGQQHATQWPWCFFAQ